MSLSLPQAQKVLSLEYQLTEIAETKRELKLNVVSRFIAKCKTLDVLDKLEWQQDNTATVKRLSQYEEALLGA